MTGKQLLPGEHEIRLVAQACDVHPDAEDIKRHLETAIGPHRVKCTCPKCEEVFVRKANPLVGQVLRVILQVSQDLRRIHREKARADLATLIHRRRRELKTRAATHALESDRLAADSLSRELGELARDVQGHVTFSVQPQGETLTDWDLDPATGEGIGTR